MKKILCVFFAIGVSVLSFAGGAKNEKPLSNAEFMSQVGTDLIKVSTIIPGIEKEMDGLRKDTAKYIKQINDLTTEKQNIAKLFVSQEVSTMLIEYPLSIRYDSALVDLSQQIIKYYGIAEDKDNKDYCKLKLPYLKGYQEYNDEIYTLISRIQSRYFGIIDMPYPEDQFDKELQDTKYYKRYDKDGIEGIPYLNGIITSVRELALSKKLTKEFLQEMMDKLK